MQIIDLSQLVPHLTHVVRYKVYGPMVGWVADWTYAVLSSRLEGFSFGHTELWPFLKSHKART